MPKLQFVPNMETKQSVHLITGDPHTYQLIVNRPIIIIIIE